MPPFHFGTAYYPDHWPEVDWESDLRHIRASGITHVRFGEFSWSWIEPRPGEFDFCGFDRFIELAVQADLQVLLCTPTCTPPPWLFARWPAARMQDQHGRLHVGHRHFTCYNHPNARDAAEQIIRRLAEHYRDHPNVCGWQIDNEPNAGESIERGRIYDYNPLTLQKYRCWLQKRYATLDELNERWVNNFWSKRVSSWEELDPPRPTLSGSTNPAAWLEWSRFRAEDVADQIRWQADLLREINPNWPLGTNIPQVSPLSAVWLGQDYWQQAEGMDFIGLTCYNFSHNPLAEERALAFSLDVERSAACSRAARFGVLEIQAGPHVLPWRMSFVGGWWQPDFLRRSAVTCAAHGAEFVYPFLWRGTRGGAEFGMNSLAEMDGSPSPRSQALPGIIAAAEAARGVHLAGPPAYMHYSQDSLHLAAYFDPDDTADTTLVGWHALLTDLGYRVEFLRDEDLVRLENLPPGPLVLAYSTLLNTACRQAIAGATRPVISGYATGFFDEFSRIELRAPGALLADVLGVLYEGFEPAPAPHLPGLPRLDQLLMQTRLVASDEWIAMRGEHHLPCLVRRALFTTLAFDLGTWYARLSEDQFGAVLDWARANLNL